ncbi:pirin family protein [Paraburkholderia largidicola]|uniref:Putative quercetin 2,3-dioxygenase n=1 Tax=Paraburkholderia largidicola TaxID=3014751 RepID=A0A7I8BXN2_9BURK|nr:pirin family protein [Paraburkholderia sp. PGU16]BCF93021.1 putative quercetin 2,3-dioxygenase [Paraburkholderia sp. PGU16]
MIEHRPFLSLGAIRRDWLDARLHFRFGETGHADHAPLGPLYVWNDDVFAPHSGFGLHAHRDAEIVTWVRSGAITHEDDAGNCARLVADSVQAMSAGTAIHHAERNEEDMPARLFQIWLRPRTPGGTPRWATRACSRELREGRFITLASGDPADVSAGALPINADARVRIATLREGTPVQHVLPMPGLAYLVADHGRLDVGYVRLAPRDGVVIRDEAQLMLTARDDTDVVIVELLRKGG